MMTMCSRGVCGAAPVCLLPANALGKAIPAVSTNATIVRIHEVGGRSFIQISFQCIEERLLGESWTIGRRRLRESAKRRQPLKGPNSDCPGKDGAETGPSSRSSVSPRDLYGVIRMDRVGSAHDDRGYLRPAGGESKGLVVHPGAELIGPDPHVRHERRGHHVLIAQPGLPFRAPWPLDLDVEAEV